MKGLIFLMIFAFNSFGARLKIVSPCSNDKILETEFEIKEGLSVGEVTIKKLEEFVIPHIGTAQGLNSIYNTPVGSDAINIIDNDEMHTYGWCYSINGFSPELYPNAVDFTNNDEVVWWFGFARYKSGDWITQCENSFTQRTTKFCDRILQRN